VARFVSELKLTPEQIYLVNYHSEYMLFRNDDQAPSVDFSRYTDHRKKEDLRRSDRMRRNVTDCIHSLDHTDPKQQETYKRILARGRSNFSEIGNVTDDLQREQEQSANQDTRLVQAEVSEAHYHALPDSANRLL